MGCLAVRFTERQRVGRIPLAVGARDPVILTKEL